MSTSITLPPAPKHYDVRDQNQLRRKLMEILRDMENRLRALEAA
jgi:hypothetical protein